MFEQLFPGEAVTPAVYLSYAALKIVHHIISDLPLPLTPQAISEEISKISEVQLPDEKLMFEDREGLFKLILMSMRGGRAEPVAAPSKDPEPQHGGKLAGSLDAEKRD